MSNRVILIFLGIIFLIIIVLSSQKLSAGIKNKAAGLFPAVHPVPTEVVAGGVDGGTRISTTPTHAPSPTIAHFAGSQNIPSQTPNTGPEGLSFLIIGMVGAGGIAIKRLSKEERLQ